MYKVTILVCFLLKISEVTYPWKSSLFYSP